MNSYRALAICVVVQTFVGITAEFALFFADRAHVTSVVYSSISMVMTATIIVIPILAYRVAVSVGSGVPWLWAAAMFVPCLSFLLFLPLSVRVAAAESDRASASAPSSSRSS